MTFFISYQTNCLCNLASSHLITKKQQNFVQCLTLSILKISFLSLDFQSKCSPITVLLIFPEKGQHIVFSYSSHNPTEHWIQDFIESVLIFWARIEKGHILYLTWEKATLTASITEVNNHVSKKEVDHWVKKYSRVKEHLY